MQFNPSLHPPKDNSERLYVPAHVWVPELFEPNAKPDRNAVELDWSRPITTGLRSYGIDQYDFVPETVLRFWKEANRPEALPDWIHFNRPTRNDEAILLTHMGNDWLDGATAVTMFVRCRFTGVSHSNEDSLIGQLSQLQGGNANEAKRVLLRYKSDVPHLEWKVFNGTADTNHVDTYDLDDDKFHDIVCRYNGVELEMWVDGVSTGAATAFTDALENASHTKVPEVMGGHACTGSAVTDAPRFDLHSWAIWDRGIENYHIYDITKRGSLACMLKPKSSPSRALNKSTVLPIPNPRFEVMELFEPKKKPEGEFRLNWDHHFAGGLTHAIYFEGDDVINYVTEGEPSTHTGDVNQDGYDQTTTGRVVYPVGAFNDLKGCAVWDFTSNGNAPAAFGKFINLGDNNFTLHRNNSDTVFTIRINADDTSLGITDLWVQAEKRCTCNWDSVLPRRWMYVNGIYQAEDTSAFSSSGSLGAMDIGNRSDGIREIEGRMKYVLIYAGRTLSASEEKEIHANPKQILIPK